LSLNQAPKHQGRVGIFWIFKGRVLADSVPPAEGEEYGEFVNGLSDHCNHWSTLQKQLPELRRYEYEQVPRGRVVYNTVADTFAVYGSERFVRNESQRAMILDSFQLPPDRTRFQADEHYGPVPGMLRD
jgi:hypothetical protein